MKIAQFNKVAVIGIGYVGSTVAFSLSNSELIHELLLVDINDEKSRVEALDLAHGASFSNPMKISSGSYKDLKGADIIIICAGAAQTDAETRMDLLYKNVELYKKMIPEIIKYNSDAIVIVVTNPVDIMTKLFIKESGMISSRVIGSGTVLDTSRFKFALSQKLKIDPHNIHAYIIGEHGDSQLATWSSSFIGGLNFIDFCESYNENPQLIKEKIEKHVREAAYEIIRGKGYTNFAISLAVKRIVETILSDDRSILTVSSYINNVIGLNDVCLSLPSVISKEGVIKVLPIKLNMEEKQALYNSANILKEKFDEIK